MIGIAIGNTIGKRVSHYWTPLNSVVENAEPTKVVITLSKEDTTSLASDFVVRDKSAFINNMSDFAVGLYNLNQGQYFNGKTYLTYFGYDDNPYIITYTHSTRAWSNPVMIGINPLVNGDGHGEPALFIDATGYIHLIWGGHGTAFRYSKSTNPEDITAWTAKTSPASGTYPQLLQFSNGTLYLFYRNADTPKKWGYQSSSDGGDTWGAFTEVSHDFSYMLVKKGIGDTIHIVINGYPQVTNINRENVYYIIYNGGWKNIKGDALTLPLDHTADILVYNNFGKYTPAVAYDFDSANKPYLLFTEGTDELGAYNYKFAKWVTNTWVMSDVGISTSNWRDFATNLIFLSVNNFETYLITGGASEAIGGNVEKWISSDNGATWTKSATIKEGIFIDPVIIKDFNAEFKLFFAQYRGVANVWENRGFAYGSSGFLKNNKTINSLSRDVTNKILTLNLASPVYSLEELEVVFKSNPARNVTNNVIQDTNTAPVGILNYYRFDEASGNAIDIISANNGTVTGATQNVTGKVGKCVSFDGNDKIVLSAQHTILNTSSLSVAFWLKCNAVNITAYFMDKTNSPVTNSRITFAQVNADLLFAIRGNAGAGQMSVTYPAILTTDWMFIVGVRNVVTHKINLYVNAVPFATPANDTSDNNIGPFTLKIGSKFDDSQNHNGSIDELGIWTKALTDAEILRMYNSGVGRTHPF